MLALEEDRVERLRVEVRVERLAVGADLAVHRPGVDEVRLLRPVRRRGRRGGPWWPRRGRTPGPSGPAASSGAAARRCRWRPGAPPVTGSEPPSQKSFWTSTTMSARFMLGGYRSTRIDRADRSVPRGWSRSPARPWRAGAPPAGSSARARRCRSRASSSGSRPTTSPSRTSGTSRERSSPSFSAGCADADHLGLGDAVGGEPAQGVLAAADRDLVLALLGDRDHLAGRSPRGRPACRRSRRSGGRCR